MTKTRVGIFGYGNLGRGVELACRQNDDLELVALFTRRDPATVKPLTEGVPVFAAADMEAHQADVDVLVLCGGSANDLPEQTPACASMFNVVDSFDTHANIPAHFADVDAAAKVGGKVAVISAGWDPGMFSIARLYASSVLPEGEDYTFWGRGVSQGHSDAIRRIEGVADARQYTVPVASALEAVRNGEKPQLTTRQKHTRECFVVAEEGADLAAIEKAIVEMPNYFADYDTTVTFISQEELNRDHAGIPHGVPLGCDRSERRAYPRGGVLAQAGFKSRVHRQRAGGLRPCRAPLEPRGRRRVQDDVRHRPCLPLREK